MSIPDPHHWLNQFRTWVKEDESRLRGEISPGSLVIDNSFTKMLGTVVWIHEDRAWVQFSDGNHVIRKLSEIEAAP